MNKHMKQKLGGVLLCFGIGIFILIYSFMSTKSEEIHSYMQGFAVGLLMVAIYFLIIIFSSLKSEKIKHRIEIKQTDERYQYIYYMAMAWTFRLSIFLEAIASIIYAFLNKMSIAQGLGLIVGIQLIIYLIFYSIIKIKN